MSGTKGNDLKNGEKQRRSIGGLGFLVLALIAVGISLGVWQVKRLAWKNDLLQTLQSRMDMPAVPLPETLEDLQSWQYRHVTMAGQFLHDHAFRVAPRVLNGKNGYHLVVPFERASGGIVFVNRGWVEKDTAATLSRPDGMMQVSGVIRVLQKPRFAPENDPVKQDWYWIDVNAMAHSVELDVSLPVVIQVTDTEENIYPAGIPVFPDMANNHLQYAIFWFGMAFLLLVLYGIYVYREKKRGSI